MSQKNKTLVRLQLRLPEDLAEYLRQQASQNLRSLNNEMVSRLEHSRERLVTQQPSQPGTE